MNELLTAHNLIHAGMFLLIVVSVTMLIYNLFGARLEPEPPINRQIALALGIGKRQTIFETPGVRQVLLFMMVVARRFPLFRTRIRTDLEASGNPSGYGVEEYLSICLGCGLLFLGVAAAMAPLFGPFAVVVVIGLPILGMYAPLWSLGGEAAGRSRSIAKQLPYTLDLVGLMMGSGSTFSEAIATIIRDDPEDPLNQELRLVQNEIEFGTPRATALMNMAMRVNIESLRGVVGAINQSEALGTPLSSILSNQASMLRNLRSVAAEEAAAKASLRILIPSMLILIAVGLVVLAPVVLRFVQSDGALLGP